MSRAPDDPSGPRAQPRQRFASGCSNCGGSSPQTAVTQALSRIRWHLEQEQMRVLSTSMIRRILHQAGLITPQPVDGTPASTLTDNGRVYTARFGGGRNAFEYLLPVLGVRQKTALPPPQTQSKIERFHQTCSAGYAPDRPPDYPRSPAPARRVPRALQRTAPTPSARTQHARPRIPGDPQSRPSRPQSQPSVPPQLRPPRPQRNHDPPPRRPDCTTSRPGVANARNASSCSPTTTKSSSPT